MTNSSTAALLGAQTSSFFEAASERCWPEIAMAVPRLRRLSLRIAPTMAVIVLVFPEPGGLQSC